MNRFEAVMPFVGNFKVFVTVEGDTTQVPYLQLQETVNLACLKVLSPDYLPWLEQKGGPCPAMKPAILPHTPPSAQGETACTKCAQDYEDKTKPPVVETVEVESTATREESDQSAALKGKRAR